MIVENGLFSFSAEQNELIAEFAQVATLFAAPGRIAITLGGSYAKKQADALSDFDCRLYADDFVTENWMHSPGWEPYQTLKTKWRQRGYRHVSIWRRTVADVNAQLDSWEAGEIAPTPVVWSIWGYHILTDIASQTAISDPDGLVAGWKERLSIYPFALKAAILNQHGEVVRYWKQDYHYQNKVVRGDAIFLASLSAKIVHSLSQVLFALNETYFPGDGWNARDIENFKIAPPRFSERVVGVLYPESGPHQLETQRAQLLELIEEVETILSTNHRDDTAPNVQHKIFQE